MSPCKIVTPAKFTLRAILSPRANFCCAILTSVPICFCTILFPRAIFSFYYFEPNPILNTCDNSPIYGSFKTADNFSCPYNLGFFKLLTSKF